MTELKPCPFCGGEAYFLTSWHVKNTAFDSIGVECKSCGAQPYQIRVYEGTDLEKKREAAAKKWNRRSVSE